MEEKNIPDFTTESSTKEQTTASEQTMSDADKTPAADKAVAEQPEASEAKAAEEGTEKKKKSSKKGSGFFGIYLMLSLVLVAAAASTALSVVTLNKVLEQPVAATTTNKIYGMEDDQGETQENDVRIGGQYVIRSTKAISDAYKLGERADLNDKEKETLDMASDVLSSVIKGDMTTYDKEKAVYEWMTKNLSQDQGLLPVIPTTQADCDNPYGVLKYHNAVCVGYATTFRLFMEMLDIPCMVVHDTGLGHSWDLVQLDDEWYHTDIYYDAGSGNYKNFNMNDSMCQSSGHDWDTSFFPSAGSLKYNMLYQSASRPESIYSVPAELRKAIDDKKETLAYKFKKDEITEQDAAILYSMVNYISSNSVVLGDLFINNSFSLADDYYLFIITIEYYNQDDPSMASLQDLPQEELDKITKAINDAYGDLGIDFNPSEIGDPAYGYDSDYNG